VQALQVDDLGTQFLRARQLAGRSSWLKSSPRSWLRTST
jgi:hypothetical protein